MEEFVIVNDVHVRYERNSRRKFVAMFLLVILMVCAMQNMVAAQQSGKAKQSAADAKTFPNDPEGILNMDIDQLGKVDVRTPSLNIEVTSVTKQESTVGHSAAAIYVITSEMIARSPATNIPDLLRIVPGLQVARIDSHSWSISSRGFSGRFAGKLLVLVDGRSVYSPVTSGTYWDVQDTLLEDIARIEVIRGPGGTIWGANAVNGVINIITKKAEKTQGQLVTYGGGTQDRALGGFRTGGILGDGMYYRIYGKHKEESPGYSPDGEAHDGWRQGRAGFRVDWKPDRAETNLMTVQGEYYLSREGIYGDYALPVSPYEAMFLENENVSGGNVLARWTHVFDESSDWSLQTYYDRTQRLNNQWKQSVNTYDVEFQHRFPVGGRHKLIWGSDFRLIHDDEATEEFAVIFDPPKKTTTMFSMFVQDEIALVEDRLYFTVGSKFEHNDYSGFEYQPTARVLYTPDNKRSAWASVSRAVHVLGRIDQDFSYTFLPVSIPVPPGRYFPRLQNNPDLPAEDMIAYELGYRAQPTPEFSYDIALFYNAYEDLLSLQRISPYFDSYGNMIVPIQYGVLARGQTYGAEITGKWSISECWQVTASYSALHMQLTSQPGSEPYAKAGNCPCNQMYFASSWDLGCRWQFDMAVRYVDSLPNLEVPSYITMDFRLAWRPRKNLELALIGRNLLDSHHLEYNDIPHFSYYGTEVQRSVFANATWRY